MSIYVAAVKPHESLFKNRMDLINEIFGLFISECFIFFTDYVTDNNAKF